MPATSSWDSSKSRPAATSAKMTTTDTGAHPWRGVSQNDR
jgi:hypothetical protein